MFESDLYLDYPLTGATRFGNLVMQSQVITAFIVIAAVGRVILFVYYTWHHARKARSLGCEQAPLYAGQDPFGISTLFETLDAAKKNLLPRLAEGRIAYLSHQYGRYVATFRMRQAGREILFTADPKNIQAMLATQFKDFGLGDMRRNVAHPVVGHGIVSSSYSVEANSLTDRPSSLLMAKVGIVPDHCFGLNSLEIK